MMLSPAMNTAATVGRGTDTEGDDAGRNGPGRSPTIETDRRLRQWPALAISSTPLPFQRNFTTLGRPIPPDYTNATVSPVHCEVSIPLNPKVSGAPCGGINLPR